MIGRRALLAALAAEEAAMKRTMVTCGLTLALGIVLGALGATVLHAQGEGIKRTLLQRKDVAGVEGREAVLGAAEIAPGFAAGKHIHHGIEKGKPLAEAVR